MTVLRQRMTEDMQVRNLSHHTQASYLQQVSLFARHFDKSPDVLTPEHIRTYQVYLTNERKLATGSIHIAVAALRFLYKITLKRKWTLADVLPLPKKPQKLPVILSPEEVVHFLGCVTCRKQRVTMPTSGLCRPLAQNELWRWRSLRWSRHNPIGPTAYSLPLAN
jgi:integrase/recombinase XerD